MKNKKNWLWFLLFGSIWGMSEVFAGGILYASGTPHSSIFLTAWALFILAVARGIVNKPGSSAAIGAIATLFKLVNATPFICHLLGIFALGVAFDVTASLLLKKERRSVIWKSLTGVVSAYGGYALFALVITYIVRYDIWVAGGWPKVANHIFASGSIAALAGAVLVPLGYLVGMNSGVLVERRSRFVYAASIAGVVVLWVLGRFVG
ncbi:hypothetical protein ACFLT2_11735 [Acidobacteriota bacterium]